MRRYEPFIYNPDDPEEIAAKPAALDLADPLIRERMALEASLRADNPDETARREAYRRQSITAEAVFGTLEHTEPIPGASLTCGGDKMGFDLTTDPAREAGGVWQGFRSPYLSRLKLYQAGDYAMIGALVDLWRDHDLWTQPVHGHRLT